MRAISTKAFCKESLLLRLHVGSLPRLWHQGTHAVYLLMVTGQLLTTHASQYPLDPAFVLHYIYRLFWCTINPARQVSMHPFEQKGSSKQAPCIKTNSKLIITRPECIYACITTLQGLMPAAGAVQEAYPTTDVLLEKLQEVLEKADMEVCL